MLSDRVRRMNDSKTMYFAAKAIEMKNNNPDFIDLTVGEPDFPTPQNIKDAAYKAIKENKTKYTVNSGILELRIAFLGYLKNKWELDYKPDEILVSTGAKQGIFNAVMALVNDEDEVIIPKPYYPSHLEMVNFTGADPILVDTDPENGFKITAQQIRENITPNTRALILCNPNNPTGSVYSRDELQAIAEEVIDNDLFVISDEVYEQLTYNDEEHICFASISPEVKKRTVICNGVSKAFSMTGWRIGLSAGPAEIIKAMAKLQSHTTSCANVPAQHAALEAFMYSQENVQEMKSEFSARRDLLEKELSSFRNIRYSKPQGAFYYFLDISHYLGKTFEGKTISNSTDLAEYLLEQAQLAVVPGIGFGVEGFIRISYTNSISTLKDGIQRMKKHLEKLNKIL